MTDTAVEQDVVDLLVQQHTRIRDLFVEVESSTAAARVSSFHRLVWLLAVHEAVDEQVVHPLTRLHVHGGTYIVADLLAEERRTRQTLAALEEMGADAPEFPRLLTELRTTVLEQANREEAYEFRYLRRDVPAGELRALSAVLRTAEAVAPTHPTRRREGSTMSTDAIVLLKQDHNEIRRLFRQFRSAETKASKDAVVRRVLKALTTYSYLENECMHPELRRRLPDLEDDVLRSYEENHVADVLCTELAAMTPGDERFDAKATVLIETVSRHFDKEEQDWFRQVRQSLGRKQLQEIGAQMIKLREKAPREPAQPGSATVTGDVVDLLLHQHTQIRDLFLEVESATGKARTEAFQRLVRLLAVHETAEEQVVHPVTRLRVHGGDDIVGDRLAEEHAAKETLAELEKMGPDAPDFPQLLNQLRIDVLDHAGKEEAYEFRYLRREVSAGELRTMAAAVRAAEAIAPTHPHPGVESATANTVAGPALSLFDRTKDLVRKAITSS